MTDLCVCVGTYHSLIKKKDELTAKASSSVNVAILTVLKHQCILAEALTAHS